MKIRDLLKHSYLKTVRDKKNIYFVLILVILSILLLAVLNFRGTFLFQLNDSFITNPVSRNLIVDPNSKESIEHWDEEDYDYGFDKILNLDHVKEIYYFPLDNNYGTDSSFKSEKYDGKLELLYGSKAMIPKLTAGRKIEEDETGVAVCSNYFYPSHVTKESYHTKNPILYEKDLLNKTFEIETEVIEYDNGPKVVGKLNKQFEIVGLFDVLSTDGFLDVCYISPKDMEEIYNASVRNLNNPQETKTLSYIVVIDDYNNMQQTIEEIKKLGFNVNPQSEIDFQYVAKLKRICMMIVILLIIAIIAMTIFYVKKKIHNNLYESGISIALGYRNLDVIKINVIQMLYIALFSYICGSIIYKLLLHVVTNQFKEKLLLANLYKLFDDDIVIYALCAFIICIFPIIVNIIITRLNLNNQLINLLRNDKE